MARLRASQVQAIADHAIVTSIAVSLVALATTWWFRGRADDVLMGSWLALTVLVNMAGLLLCRIGRQRSQTGPLGVGIVRAIAIDAGLCALIDLSPVHYLASIASPDDLPLLAAVVAAVFATGGWLCAALPSAAISWTLTSGVVLIAQLLAMNQPYALPLAVLAVTYGVVLLIGIGLTARVYENKQLAREQLREEHALVNLLLRDFEQHSSDWLWEIDAAGVLRYLSPQAARLFGRDTLGQSWLAVLERRSPADARGPDSGLERLGAALRGFAAFRDLCLPVLVHGQPAWWSLTATPLVDGEGQRTGWRGVVSDVTLLRQRERALEQLATTDPVTGLANRLQIVLHVQAAYDAQFERSPFALLMMELGGFGTLNENLGRATGDALLRECARRLRETLPDQAIPARLGGGCFAVLIPGPVARTGIDDLGQALVHAIGRPYDVAGQPIEVLAGLGVAFAPIHAQDPTGLMEMAELAMQEALRPGREPVCWFEPVLHEEIAGRRALHAGLHEAMRLGQFELAYRPRHAVTDGRLLAFSVIPGWQHPQRGRIAGAAFAALAAGSGLAVPVWQWVLARACRDAAGWSEQVALSLPMGAAEVAHSGLVHTVTAVLRECGLSPARLQLEIAEDILLGSHEGVVTALALLHALGVKVVLVEPACAPRSGAMLRNLPIDALMVAVPGVGQGNDADMAAMMLWARLALGASLGLPVIADDVADPAQLTTLERSGFANWQGPAAGPALDAVAAGALAESTTADSASLRSRLAR